MLKRLSAALLVFLFAFLPVLVVPQGAAGAVFDCNIPGSGFGNTVEIPAYPTTKNHTIRLDLNQNFDQNQRFYLRVENWAGTNAATSEWISLADPSQKFNADGTIQVVNGFAEWKITKPMAINWGVGAGDKQTYRVELTYGVGHVGPNNCTVGNYYVTKPNQAGPTGCSMKLYQSRSGQACYQNQAETGCFVSGEAVTVEIYNLKDSDGNLWDKYVDLRVEEGGFWRGELDPDDRKATDGNVSFTFTPNSIKKPSYFNIKARTVIGNGTDDFSGCEVNLTVENGCNQNQCLPEQTIIKETGNSTPFLLCDQINDANLQQQCLTCAGSSQDAGVWTAVGCIKREPTSIAQSLIKIGLGTGGGISLLMILGAGFMLSSSQGDPKKTNEAKEMITAALTGLLFIIFSVTILQFIGVKVLQIPGFGG